jgi:Domain of unknown function (DUF397)
MNTSDWRKSSHSDGHGGECVEITVLTTSAAAPARP